MGVTAPGATLIIQKAGALSAPAMAADPLKTAMLNGNWLYLYHRPQLNSTIALATQAGRDLVIYLPVLPSVDDIAYRIEQGIYAGAVGVVLVTTDWADATLMGWTNLEAATAVATINGHVWKTALDVVLPAAARVVRITMQYGITAFRPGHSLIWPQPTVIAAGIASSGFVPFDDTLITSTGAPVNTEMLDRCIINRNAVLRDRQQGVCGFAQGSTVATATYGVSAINFTKFADFRPKIPLPDSQPYSLRYSVVAIVDAGGTADLILITTPLGVVTVAADGALYEGAIGCIGKRPQISVSCKATAGNNTYLSSFAMFWLPGG